MSTEIPEKNPVAGASTDSVSKSPIAPELMAQVELAAKAAGHQISMVEECARSHSKATHGGLKAEAEQQLAFSHRRRLAEEGYLREATRQLRHTEPKVIIKGQRGKVGLMGWMVVLFFLASLLMVLWYENGAAAQTLLSTGAFDVDTLERARTFMLTPIGVGIAMILGFKVLPPYVRQRAFLGAFSALAIAFLVWAVCFAIEAEQFRNASLQTISLGEEVTDLSLETDDAPSGGPSAWLMFCSLAIMMALTTFIGHSGVENFLSKYESWMENPDYSRALEVQQAHEYELRTIEDSISTFIKIVVECAAFEENAAAISRLNYVSKRRTSCVLGIAFLATALATGCSDSTMDHATHSRLERWSAQTQAADGNKTPIVRVVALSPLLPALEKNIAREQLETEVEWIVNRAPVGSVTMIIDGLDCVPIARLEAVPGVSRIRKKALTKQVLAIRSFLSKSNPRAKDDGRIHLPRLTQTAKQWGLPSNSHVIVLGNPLFLNDGKDKFYSMRDGRVPSDGCLAEDPKLNIYSILGREKALNGQFWHLGWSDDSVFEDDTHRQAVLRFWHLYLKGQAARLVTAQPSLVAAAEAAREGATDPLMFEDADEDVPASMVKIVKVPVEEIWESKPKATENSHEQSTEDRTGTDGEAVEIQGQQPREVDITLRQEKVSNDETNVIVNKPEMTLDLHGNLTGSDRDLIIGGQMKGQNVLMINFSGESEVESSPLFETLTEKGYMVERLKAPLPSLKEFEELLDKTHQLWLWSSAKSGHLSMKHKQAIVSRWRQGKLALCLLADNSPHTIEAASILSELIPTSTIQGDYRGQQSLHAGLAAEGGFDPISPLFHNITTLYEGTTVSTVAGPGLVPVCNASNGMPLISTFQKDESSRLVVHCGFTSFYQRFWNDAGISRFAANCAGWLSKADVMDFELGN